jgi:hypothetical protein
LALESHSRFRVRRAASPKSALERRLSIFLVLFFPSIGGAVDFLYFDAVSSTAFPIARSVKNQAARR